MKTTAGSIFPKAIFCLLLATWDTAAAERVVAEQPVRLVTSFDSGMFPESWRTAPILASGESLSEDQFERVRAILERSARKYPPVVLQKHLKTVYVLSELKYSGIVTSGTNSQTDVYLKVGDPKMGFTDAHIEGVFHAEFSSILLRNCQQDFKAAAWQKINPPGFEYLGNGVDAVKQKKAGLVLRRELHEQGFLKEYSQSTLENDLNAFAMLIFSGDGAMWELAEKFPKLQRKLELTLDFYQRIDPAFTEKHFRTLVK